MRKTLSASDGTGIKTVRVEKTLAKSQKQKKRDLPTPTSSPGNQQYYRDLVLREGEKKVWDWCKYTL